MSSIFGGKIDLSVSFDDILLVPRRSEVVPSEASVSSFFTRGIKVSLPVSSAAMDTVTESSMAIAMAKNGGIGCLHKNCSIEDQVREVRRVKKHESGIVSDPICVNQDSRVSELLDIRKHSGVGGFPVIDDNQKLVGIVTNRDILFVENNNTLIKDVMTKNVVTIYQDADHETITSLFRRHKVEKLVMVDKDHRCIGLVTIKDIKSSQSTPFEVKDKKGRLLVAAATGVGEAGIERAEALVKAEVDALIFDTAHGHSSKVLETIKHIKDKYKDQVQVVGGNVATPEAVRDLVQSGADAVKVGVGPGSICTTRIITGVGVPQFSAIYNCAREAVKTGTPIVADGGIRSSGDIAKAIAAGASTVMLGGLLAGTDESPGEIVHYGGSPHKEYRGMGSIAAMSRGSSDRYFQSGAQPNKLVPEGVEGVVPYKGPVSVVIYQLIGGLKSAMGYTGNKDIFEMQTNCSFNRITGAALKENHPHNVLMIKESPNYNT